MSRLLGRREATAPLSVDASQSERWQYMAKGAGKWCNFNDYHSEMLTKAHGDSAQSVTLKLNNAPYVVNMTTSLMALTGSDYNFTNSAIRVRRAPLFV
jgi:hypothetical protein